MKLLSYFLVGFLTFILGAGVTYFVIKQYPQYAGLSKGQAQVQSEFEQLLIEVGKLMDLPSDERPTIATVSDIEQVKGQDFFKKAKNGDKVLIYTNSKRAILFRPSEKRVIEVGAVNINQQSQASPTPEATPVF